MALCYKKLWKMLIDRDMTRTDLRGMTGISTATLAKMSHGDCIESSILDRICKHMKCNIGDIVDYVPDAPMATESAEWPKSEASQQDD